ncbi:MAG: ASPIC/UnbV domain-containing protein, partial [Acidobacteriota bacterium]
GDGDLDLVVVSHSAAVSLLRNEGGDRNRWLVVEPRSRQGNRFAVGAKVRVEVGGVSRAVQIGSQASYLSQNPYQAHFGLGAAQTVDRVLVEFPGGKRVERRDVAANQRLVIWEETP